MITNPAMRVVVAAIVTAILGGLLRRHYRKVDHAKRRTELQFQAYSELIQFVLEIERDDVVRPGRLAPLAAGVKGPLPVRVRNVMV